MKTTKMLTILVLAVLVVLSMADTVNAERKMYWADAGAHKVQRASLDGTEAEVIASASTATGVAVDIAGGKVYWTAMGADKIQRANLDGSEVEDLVTGLDTVFGIALDITDGKMYWTDWGTNKIQRANLDGSDVEDVITSLNHPRGMTLDIASGKMYWTDSGPYRIRRANLDGSAVEDMVSGLSGPHDVSVDIVGGKMYWVDAGSANKVQRANLDGSGIEDLVTGLGYPYGIALDITRFKVYWTDYNNGKIQRANLDGSEVEDVVTGLSAPRLITVVPSVFTYQGRLIDNNSVADGLYDVRFAAYDEEGDMDALAVVGAQDVDVIDGYFTVQLGFEGAGFDGNGIHWLEIAVRPGDSNDPNAYVTLSPRQELTPAPYAAYAETAGSALATDADWAISDSNMFSGVPGKVGIGTATPSAKLDVNGVVNCLGTFNIGGEPVVSVNGDSCTLVGVAAGWRNQGDRCTFVGWATGTMNEGGQNTFLGAQAGGSNVEGQYNTCVGQGAGVGNKEGEGNTFLGLKAGQHCTGSDNTIVGCMAAGSITEAPGNYNTFLGADAGYEATGSGNIFIGYRAGYHETDSNSLYIDNSDTSLPLIYGDFNEDTLTVNGKIGIGTMTPQNALDVEGGVAVGATYSGTGSAPANGMIIEGSVGVGTDSPAAALSNSSVLASDGTGSTSALGLNWRLYDQEGYAVGIENTASGGDGLLVDAGNNGGSGAIIAHFVSLNSSKMLVREDGRVGIGTTAPAGTLDVNGPIYQRGGVLHADYVFEDDYELESIEEHTELMWANKHLPAIPKATVDGAGQEIIEIGTHRRGIVEELEKAHIYIEQLHNQNKALERRVAALEKMILHQQFVSAKEVYNEAH